MTRHIAVIGSAGAEEYPHGATGDGALVAAELVGRLIAQSGAVLLSGGLGGVMRAAAAGARAANGISVGIRTGLDPAEGWADVDVEIRTGSMAFYDSASLVASAHSVISIAGGVGTLQELCLAYRLKRPTVLLVGHGGWTDRVSELEWLDERRLTRFIPVRSPAAAVDQAIRSAAGQVR